MNNTRSGRYALSLLIAGLLLMGLGSARAAEPPITRNLELEALREAVRWPNATPQVILALAGQFMVSRRDPEGYAYFQECAKARPDQPLLLSLEGFFQARIARQVPPAQLGAWVAEAIRKLDQAVGSAPGLTRYLRGLVLAQLPASLGKTDAAVADLEWVLQNRERFPAGLRRNINRALAQAYTALGRHAQAQSALHRSGYPSLDSNVPLFVTDASITVKDGPRSTSPKIVEMAPRVYVAQRYDFSDIAFVETDATVVVIDAGTSEANARHALAAFRKFSSRPISHIFLTHAHWDHIGGLAALKDPGTQVFAQAKFDYDLHTVNETGVSFRSFFGPEGRRRHEVVPDRLVSRRETLTVGGTELVLYPVSGDTDGALWIHLPASGVVFVGDTFTPWLGVPWQPEGSAEGLFDSLALVRSLNPRLLIHGHVPLTQNFTIDVLPGLEAALREVYERTRQGIREGKTLVEILHQNLLPGSLRSHPRAVIPFIVMRENFIKRVYHQRTGYWKPDGEGMEVVAPREWAAVLNLLGGRQEDAFVRTARTLLDQGDYALAHKLTALALLNYPNSPTLTDVRRQALDRLREKYQQLDPFKFYIYSEWAGAELPPVE